MNALIPSVAWNPPVLPHPRLNTLALLLQHPQIVQPVHAFGVPGLDEVKNWIGKKIELVKDKFDVVVSPIRGWIDDAKNKIEEIKDKVVDKVKSAFKGILSKFVIIPAIIFVASIIGCCIAWKLATKVMVKAAKSCVKYICCGAFQKKLGNELDAIERGSKYLLYSGQDADGIALWEALMEAENGDGSVAEHRARMEGLRRLADTEEGKELMRELKDRAMGYAPAAVEESQKMEREGKVKDMGMKGAKKVGELTKKLGMKAMKKVNAHGKTKGSEMEPHLPESQSGYYLNEKAPAPHDIQYGDSYYTHDPHLETHAHTNDLGAGRFPSPHTTYDTAPEGETYNPSGGFHEYAQPHPTGPLPGNVDAPVYTVDFPANAPHYSRRSGELSDDEVERRSELVGPDAYSRGADGGVSGTNYGGTEGTNYGGAEGTNYGGTEAPNYGGTERTNYGGTTSEGTSYGGKGAYGAGGNI